MTVGLSELLWFTGVHGGQVGGGGHLEINKSALGLGGCSFSGVKPSMVLVGYVTFG